MKKIVITFVLIIVCSTFVHGEAVQVKLRTSEKPGTVRLVLESEEKMIKAARVFHSYSLVKIEFENEFVYSPEQTTGSVEVSHKGVSLFITIAGLKNINVFRLSGPPRLVIDAEVDKSVTEAAKTEEPQELSKLSDLVLVVDPGHGGYSIGLVGSDYKEKDVVLSISRSLRYAAGQAGAKVFLTRYSDRYVSIRERIKGTYNSNPGIFVSLHLSSSPDFVIYYAKMDSDVPAGSNYMLQYGQLPHITNSGRLSRSVAGALKNKFKRNVKVRQMYLPLLSSVSAPAIFIELPDGKYFDFNKENRYGIATAIMMGIEEYEKQ